MIILICFLLLNDKMKNCFRTLNRIIISLELMKEFISRFSNNLNYKRPIISSKDSHDEYFFNPKSIERS